MMDEFQKVASISEIPPGTIEITKFMGGVAIANEGQSYAFPNKCTRREARWEEAS